MHNVKSKQKQVLGLTFPSATCFWLAAFPVDAQTPLSLLF